MSWQNCVLTGKVKDRAQKLLGEYNIIIHKCKTISPHTSFVLFCFLSVWFLIWLLICISLMMWTSFECAYLLAVHLLWWNVCLNLLHIFTWVVCFLIIGYWDCILNIQRNQILWNYSPPACRLSFCSYKDAFEVFYFDKV